MERADKKYLELIEEVKKFYSTDLIDGFLSSCNRGKMYEEIHKLFIVVLVELEIECAEENTSQRTILNLRRCLIDLERYLGLSLIATSAHQSSLHFKIKKIKEGRRILEEDDDWDWSSHSHLNEIHKLAWDSNEVKRGKESRKRLIEADNIEAFCIELLNIVNFYFRGAYHTRHYKVERTEEDGKLQWLEEYISIQCKDLYLEINQLLGIEEEKARPHYICKLNEEKAIEIFQSLLSKKWVKAEDLESWLCVCGMTDKEFKKPIEWLGTSKALAFLIQKLFPNEDKRWVVTMQCFVKNGEPPKHATLVNAGNVKRANDPDANFIDKLI